ncbi:MAG: cytochrome c oxidase subunit II [Myxococcales bacterium]|nr:cytochrome c oxidase subunit II [Myxococcales bacterium]
MNEPEYGWWLPPNVSVQGDDIDTMINVIHWFMLALFVGWGAFMVFCLVRFRERPGHVAVYKPIKAGFSKWLEVGVAVAEAVILAFFAMPVWAKIKNDFPTQDNPVVIRVVAEQFKWLFHYPGQDGKFGRTGVEFYADDNPAGLDFDDEDGFDDITVRGLHFPVGRPVIARLTAKDVIHSFKMPVMRITQDLIPGMEIPIWFEAKSTGKFQVGCAQLCGLGHYEMKADLIIESPEDYQRWLDEEHAALGLDDY